MTAAMVACVAVSCSKGPSASSGNKAFASADAESQKMWQAATAAAATNDYVTSVTFFRKLYDNPNLTAEQHKAAEENLTVVYDRMSDAASKGDAAAVKAQEEISQISREMRGR